jgi:S-adenosylmethionine hydrolase
MIVTLLTDFGTSDYFVAAMKGVILSLEPRATLVDVTHEIPPQDVRAGAFTLLAVYRDFPPGTVHLAVVDPGVGSERRPVVVSAGGRSFVGPDNGLFGHVYEAEPGARVYHLTEERFFRAPVSATFHGRDVFAPVAGALASGVAPAELGEEISDYVRLDPLRPTRLEGGALRGVVLHVDRFGNCITSLTREDLPEEGPGIRLEVNGREVRAVRRFYAEAEPGQVFAIWGSAGFLELSANRDSAARLLGVRAGDTVTAWPG